MVTVATAALQLPQHLTCCFVHITAPSSTRIAAVMLSASQAHSFELECDTTKFGAYARGGIVTQHKESKVRNGGVMAY